MQRFSWAVSLLVGGLLVGIAGGCGQKGEIPQPDRELVYKTAGETPLHLYMFEPKGVAKDEKRPAVLLFHGGGWMTADPPQMFPHCKYFADRGLVAFSGQYRVKEVHDTDIFAGLEDGVSAIRYVRQHADELGVDPDAIIVGGMSAGGHMAIVPCLFKEISAESDDTSVSAEPNAMLMWNPVLDATMTGYEHGAKRLGDRAEEISPVHHVRSGLPPCIIFHATGDTCTPYENAKDFTKLSKQAGNLCVLYTFEGRRHGFANSAAVKNYVYDNRDFDRALAEADRFLTFLGYLEPEVVPEDNNCRK